MLLLCLALAAPSAGACVSFSFDGSWPGVTDARRAALAQAVAVFVVRSERWCAPVRVERASRRAAPRILVRPARSGPHTVLLHLSRGFASERFVYPLAHELCHLASGYERLEGLASNWLHEALCEAVAHAFLRSPAYAALAPGGVGARASARILLRAKRTAPGSARFASWLARYEPRARAERYLRPGHRILALRLTPVFARSPAALRALASLPPSPARLAPYLAHWHASAPPVDRAGVRALAQALAVALGSS